MALFAARSSRAVLFAAGAEGDGDGEAVGGVLVLDLVDEVVLVGLDDEVLVVDEENILGDGDRLVAVVDGGGAVEELEALLVALVLGWRCLDEGVLEEAVERAGADEFLGVIADAGDGLEDVLDGDAFHGGDADEGGVAEEEEFVTEVFFGGFEACRFLAFGVEEVEFVSDDEAGLFFLLNHAGDFTILRGDAGGEVDDEEADVGTADGALTAHRGEDLDGVFHAGAFTEAGGIDDVMAFLAPDVGDVDGIAGGAGDGGDHGAFVFEDGVDEGGFAGVGFSDDRDFEAVLEIFMIDFGLFLGFEFGELEVDPVEEVTDAAPVFGGGGHAVAKSEDGEVAGGVIVVRAVGLVHDEDDVGIRFAEELGHFFVDWVDASAGIDDEDDEVGGVHRDAGLEGDLVGEAIFVKGADASGIDEFARVLGEGAGCGDAVTGDPGLIEHDGDTSSGQTIKEGGLPDIGTTDDSDLEWTSRHDFYELLRLA